MTALEYKDLLESFLKLKKFNRIIIMKIFIASSEEHSGKIEEDMYINNMCISLGIESEISTIKNIIKKARKMILFL